MNKRTICRYTTVWCLLCLIFFVGHMHQAVAAQAPSPQTPLPPGPPGEIDVVESIAHDIYNQARNNRWKQIGHKVSLLRRMEQSLAAARPDDSSTRYLPKLAETVTALEQAVAVQKRLDVMVFANKIMIICAKMAEPYSPRIPVDVAILGYCSRKLEIYAETEPVARLAEIVFKMHLAWQTLIPHVVEHQGGDREVKRFAEIMKRLEKAQTAPEFARLAPVAIEGVGNLERHFSR